MFTPRSKSMREDVSEREHKKDVKSSKTMREVPGSTNGDAEIPKSSKEQKAHDKLEKRGVKVLLQMDLPTNDRLLAVHGCAIKGRQLGKMYVFESGIAYKQSKKFSSAGARKMFHIPFAEITEIKLARAGLLIPSIDVKYAEPGTGKKKERTFEGFSSRTAAFTDMDNALKMSRRRTKESSRAQRLRHHFDLPPDEPIIAEFHCMTEGRSMDVVIQGTLYVFSDAIAFQQDLRSGSSKFHIPMRDLREVRKRESNLDPSVVLTTRTAREFFFAGFSEEAKVDETVAVIQKVKDDYAGPPSSLASTASVSTLAPTSSEVYWGK